MEKSPSGLVIHCIRSHATTSEIWQRSKLFGLDLTSYYLVAAKVQTALDFNRRTVSIKLFADCLPVTSGKAPSTHATVRKQCGN